jgi:hypothetical protein
MISNNWVYLLISGISIIYNIYSLYSKNYSFSLIIGNHKENYNSTSRISFFYKIKFIYYTVSSFIAFIITILFFVNVTMDKDIDLSFIKLF